ncbi:DUF2339 domain-containing protein [Caryophanon latum]|uniref:DUF2339 domain-containing protein n=1 Tax=Caryophanon latum TaxID=33977 RepID=A0A1C0YUH7_9BACL|nr:DUF2339 domain-containing protein [Caryophanon latum]OCS90827.1 hypothetical protein A6K76_01895 [Caryophanon latum]
MSLQKRVTELEAEVRVLRAQMDALQRDRSPAARTEQPRPEVKEQRQAAPIVSEPVVEKPKRSAEELMAAWLPKLFMVVLMLGVVWGLKVMSDYGLFGDTMKIVSAYALSLAMLAVAYWKRETWTEAAFDSLLGGTFIVGMLATAAGAILYGVLSESMALIIALLYIVYGVGVSYVRRNEVLTSFVFFTSLLLPYLLDYMEVSKPVIFMYIVVMFSVMQIVTVKYTQWYAQMIGFSASIFTLTFFLWQGDAKVSWALLIVLIVMVASSIQLLTVIVPKRAVRIWLLNSYLFSCGMLMMEEQLLPAVVSVVLFGAATAYVMKRYMKQALDILYVSTVASMFAVVVNATSSDTIQLFILPALAIWSAAYAISRRLNMSSVVLIAVSLVECFLVYVTLFSEVDDVAHHMQYVLILIYAVACYGVLRRKPMRYEQTGVSIDASDCVWLVVLALWAGYGAALDEFFEIGPFAYIVYFMSLGLVVVVLALRKRLNDFAQYSTIAMWVLFSFSFLSSTWLSETATLHVVAQLSMLAVLAWLLVLVLKFQHFATIPFSGRVIALLAYMYVVYVAFVNQLFAMDVVSSSVRLMLHTIMLFGVAAAFMGIYQRFSERIFMRIGIGLLVVAFVKLLLVDLVAINIFVRAILFIIIGAVGFYLSTRLRTKE